MNKKIIIYIVAIIIILTAVFLGQQAYFKNTGKTLISAASSQASAYLAKGASWVTSKIYPKINEEVQSRGGAIQSAVEKTKQKVSESITEKIGNYFSGIANAVEGKTNTNTTCPPAK